MVSFIPLYCVLLLCLFISLYYSFSLSISLFSLVFSLVLGNFHPSLLRSSPGLFLSLWNLSSRSIAFFSLVFSLVFGISHSSLLRSSPWPCPQSLVSFIPLYCVLLLRLFLSLWYISSYSIALFSKVFSLVFGIFHPSLLRSSPWSFSVSLASFTPVYCVFLLVLFFSLLYRSSLPIAFFSLVFS